MSRDCGIKDQEPPTDADHRPAQPGQNSAYQLMPIIGSTIDYQLLFCFRAGE
jgi:hypothetical protein